MMKTARWLLGVMAAGVVAGTVMAEEAGTGAMKAEPYYIVKTVGFDRRNDVLSISETELRAMEKTIKLEQKYFSKALSLAAKEWRDDEINKGILFPAAMLKPRTILSSVKYASAAKAEEQLNRLADLDAKKRDRNAEKEKRRPGSTRAGKKDSKSLPKKDEILFRAADLVKSKIESIMAETPAEGAPAAPAKPAAPAAIDAGGAKNAVKAAL